MRIFYSAFPSIFPICMYNLDAIEETYTIKVLPPLSIHRKRKISSVDRLYIVSIVKVPVHKWWIS